MPRFFRKSVYNMHAMKIQKSDLESLYKKYNKRAFVSPDPLETLYAYPDLKDREIVGLIAATLAYGNVKQILKSVYAVLEKMGPSPHSFLIEKRPPFLRKVFQGFKHRFTTDRDLVALLLGIRRAVQKYGSLNACFCHGFQLGKQSWVGALSAFEREITGSYAVKGAGLLPLPERGSACKRLNLYLRWMIRTDAVDPGGWQQVPRSELIIPLDVHMHRIARQLGLTQRNTADMKTAVDITTKFSQFSPKDPVKYDFVLTRFGIRKDFDRALLLQSY